MLLKVLPTVSSLTVVATGATHDHQTEAPPLDPAWLGSPDSLVAPTFEPVTEALVPVIAMRSAQLSLAGWAKATGRIPSQTTDNAQNARSRASFHLRMCGIPLLWQPINRFKVFIVSRPGPTIGRAAFLMLSSANG